MITNTTLAIFLIIHSDRLRHRMHSHQKLDKTQMLYLIRILKIPTVQPEMKPEIDQSEIDHHHKESFREAHQEAVGEENNVGNVMQNHMLNALHLVNMLHVHQVTKE